MGRVLILSLLISAAGCASTRPMERAVYNAQACEGEQARVQADADRLRATSLSGDDDRRALNAQAWADRIALDCRRWRDQVAIEQARSDARATRRRAIGEAISQNGHAGSAAPAHQQINCMTMTVGNSAFTSCN